MCRVYCIEFIVLNLIHYTHVTDVRLPRELLPDMDKISLSQELTAQHIQTSSQSAGDGMTDKPEQTPERESHTAATYNSPSNSSQLVLPKGTTEPSFEHKQPTTSPTSQYAGINANNTSRYTSVGYLPTCRFL